MAVLGACLAGASSAGAATSCSATAVRVDLFTQRFENTVANPAATPCVGETSGTQPDGNPVLVGGPLASTTATTGFDGNPGARAYAYVASAIIPGFPYMTVAELQSSAVGTCRDGKPAFGSTANVTRIYSEDRPIELPDEGVETRIPVPGGTLIVNEKQQTPTSILRRAMRLDLPFFDVVFAETSASVTSCPAARPSRRALRRAGRLR